MTQFDVGGFLLSGAFLRLPSGKVRIWKGPFVASKNENNLIKSIAYMNFFADEIQRLDFASSVLETDTGTLRSMLAQGLEAQDFDGKCFLPPSFDKFQTSFQSIMGKIHRGEIEKAVPIVFAESPNVPSKNQLARIIGNVLEASNELYPFGMWQNGEGIIGASPEVLFRSEKNHIYTMALAGTAPVASMDQLKSDPKELHEHVLVVKDIENRLSSFGWVRIEPTKVIKIGPLAHLRTEIQVQSNHIDHMKILKALHPTAALGVYPRNYGITWMKDLPYQAQRGVFGAPILFPISGQEMIALVAIRCLQWTCEGSQIGSGCGLVKDSQLQKEWDELALKRSSVLKVLGL